MKKLIAVTPRLLTEDGVEKEFVNRSYVKQLIKHDANIIMLTLNNPNVEEVLDLCDGFLITGGSDMDPKHYGETNEGLSQGVSEELDTLDKIVVEYAVKHKKPLLGICRGCQSINVVLGGSLHQHIGTDHKGKSFDHTVVTTPNDVLKFEENIITNSYHHQAVNKVAPGLQVIARHTDGTIEALVHESLPIIAIQWHPEKFDNDPVSKIIFDKFFEFIKK